MVSADHDAVIEERFRALKLEVSFGEHVDEQDLFHGSSRGSRIADLHAAFRDPDVAGILTVIGGFNSNELLADVDGDLIAANPKVFCGFSDTTALQNAMLARSRLVTLQNIAARGIPVLVPTATSSPPSGPEPTRRSQATSSAD